MVQLGIQFWIDHFPPVPPPQPRYICISFYCLQVSIAAIETSSATQISIFYLLFLTAFKIVPLGGGNEWRRSLNILHIHCDVHRYRFKKKIGSVCFLSQRVNVFINFGKFSVTISSKIAFLHSFYSFLLSPLWRGGLRTPCVPSLISQSQARCWEPSMYFLRAVLWSGQGLCLEPSRVEANADACMLSVGVCMHPLWEYTHIICEGSHGRSCICGMLGTELASWGCGKWAVS